MLGSAPNEPLVCTFTPSSRIQTTLFLYFDPPLWALRLQDLSKDVCVFCISVCLDVASLEWRKVSFRIGRNTLVGWHKALYGSSGTKACGLRAAIMHASYNFHRAWFPIASLSTFLAGLMHRNKVGFHGNGKYLLLQWWLGNCCCWFT